MKRLLFALVLVALLALYSIGAATAAMTVPVGGCPKGYHIHPIMHDEEHEGEHIHTGVTEDLNGDGYICAKHITPAGNIHVHVDNTVLLH